MPPWRATLTPFVVSLLLLGCGRVETEGRLTCSAKDPCPAGKVCDTGVCVSAGGGGGSAGTASGGSGGGLSCPQTDVGETGCSLKLLAAGSLPASQFSNARPESLAAVATSDGFLLALEDIGATDEAKVSVFAVGYCGEPALAATVDLGENQLLCGKQPLAGGLGMAWQAGKALVTSGVADCGNGAGALLFAVDGAGQALGPASAPRNAQFKSLQLPPLGGGVAPSNTADRYDFVYRVDTGAAPEVQRVVIELDSSGASFASVPAANPLGPSADHGVVASSEKIRAYAGNDPTASEVKLTLGPNDSSEFSSAGTSALSAAPFVVAEAWDTQAAFLVPAPGGAQLKALRLASGGVTETAVGNVASGAKVQSAQLAVLGDRLLALISNSSGMSVARFDGALTQLASSAAETVLVDLPPGLLAKRDPASVAMAATGTRVLVAWLNRAPLASLDALGGWAILQCAEP